jgi:hypothetical protein
MTGLRNHTSAIAVRSLFAYAAMFLERKVNSVPGGERVYQPRSSDKAR